VFVVVLPLLMTGAPRQDVRFEVGPPRAVMQGEGIIGKLGDPACLTTIQLLWFAKVFEVLVICPDLERMTCSHEKMTPF
ncbi:hypothetical protein PAXINDRAFT_36032, partial [Paxillus involutus ATCC 200175]